MAALCLMEGLATFAAIPDSGLLWQVFGFKAAFLYGAGAALLEILLFISLAKGKNKCPQL